MRAAALSVAFWLVAAVTPLCAQSYPSRPLTLICGYSAGTGADVIVRYFGEKLRPFVGNQPIVVENKVGALTVLASEAAANAKPDGYTIYVTAGNASLASPPHLFKKLPFDPIKDFTPVTTLITLPFVLTVAPDSPIKTVSDLTAHLKRRGEKASYAYGTSFGQAASERYKLTAGVPGHPVAYRTGLNSITDMKSGEIDFMFTDVTSGSMQMQQGLLKIIAVTTAQRSPSLPDIPTMQEAGVPDFDIGAWWGVWLPAKAPEAVVDKLENWFNQIVATDETREFMLRIGAAPWKGDRKLLAQTTPAEIEKWGRLIRDAHIEPQ